LRTFSRGRDAAAVRDQVGGRDATCESGHPRPLARRVGLRGKVTDALNGGFGVVRTTMGWIGLLALLGGGSVSTRRRTLADAQPSLRAAPVRRATA
jgi:hypothetical protein